MDVNERVSPMASLASEEVARIAEMADDERNHFQGLNGAAIKDEAVNVMNELRALDLTENVAELHVMGLTVVPPEKVGFGDLIDAAREKLLDVVEGRSGVRPDWLGNTTHKSPETPFGTLISHIGLEDPIFEKIMLNRSVLAIVDEQVGRNAALSSFQSIIKPKGGKPLDLHVDELIAPAPYSVHTGSINVTIPLTDYTMEAGPTSYVPGSQKFLRAPVGKEGWDQRVPVTARKGSLIVWPSSTWHGNYTGTAPGLRMALVLVYARPHMRTLENYRDDVTPEMLQRNPPRFAKLMGRHISYGWKKEGPVLDGSETLIGATAFS